MAIELPKETRDRIHEALAAYAREHLEVEFGVLQSEKLVDFMMGLVGALVYNQAIDDAQGYVQKKLLDMEGDLHETVEYES
jgi:uncharacterized protein (DUF2164 family)